MNRTHLDTFGRSPRATIIAEIASFGAREFKLAALYKRLPGLSQQIIHRAVARLVDDGFADRICVGRYRFKSPRKTPPQRRAA